MTKVLIVDDYEDWRRKVRELVEELPELQIICEVSDGVEAVQKAGELKPDLIVLDVSSTVRPNARATPTKPIPKAGKDAASTALPQPPNVNQKVPKNSAVARLPMDICYLARIGLFFRRHL